MKRIEFEVAEKRYGYDLPENWGELTQEQFVAYTGSIGDKSELDAITMARVVGMDDVVAVSLLPADWHFLQQQLSFMQDLSGYKVGRMDTITLDDGTICYGFSDNFTDVTWEEWMYADANANVDNWDVVTAVLYRPNKADWDHQSDPRVPFSQWGADERRKRMKHIGKEVLAGVALNYKLMRQALTRRYPRLFTAGGGDGKGGSGLQTLIRNIMGDNFYEEEKYLKLTVPSVLFQLERMVREERERRRRG